MAKNKENKKKTCQNNILFGFFIGVLTAIVGGLFLNAFLHPTLTEIDTLGNGVLEWQKNGGSLADYETLLSYKKKIIMDRTRREKLSEVVKNIEKVYSDGTMESKISNPTYTRAIWKIKAEISSPFDVFEPPLGYNAKNVFSHLLHGNLWTERARSACLLRNIKTAHNKDEINKNKEELYNTLINHMKKGNETYLVVSKMALDTYSTLTGFKPSGIFDFEGAINDWENSKRKEEILKIEF